MNQLKALLGLDYYLTLLQPPSDAQKKKEVNSWHDDSV